MRLAMSNVSSRWIVPVVACHLGAVAGAWTYYLAMELNWPDLEEESYDSVAAGSQNTAEYRGYDFGHPKHPTAPSPSPHMKM